MGSKSLKRRARKAALADAKKAKKTQKQQMASLKSQLKNEKQSKKSHKLTRDFGDVNELLPSSDEEGTIPHVASSLIPEKLAKDDRKRMKLEEKLAKKEARRHEKEKVAMLRARAKEVKLDKKKKDKAAKAVEKSKDSNVIDCTSSSHSLLSRRQEKKREISEQKKLKKAEKVKKKQQKKTEAGTNTLKPKSNTNLPGRRLLKMGRKLIRRKRAHSDHTLLVNSCTSRDALTTGDNVACHEQVGNSSARTPSPPPLSELTLAMRLEAISSKSADTNSMQVKQSMECQPDLFERKTPDIYDSDGNDSLEDIPQSEPNRTSVASFQVLRQMVSDAIGNSEHTAHLEATIERARNNDPTLISFNIIDSRALVRLSPARCEVTTALMFDAIEHSSYVRELVFTNVGADDKFAVCLATFLSTNTSVLKVSIDRNNIAETGFLELASMLRHNTTLRELRCSNQSKPLCSAALVTISKDIIENHTLTTFTLECKNIVARDRITLALARNIDLALPHFSQNPALESNIQEGGVEAVSTIMVGMPNDSDVYAPSGVEYYASVTDLIRFATASPSLSPEDVAGDWDDWDDATFASPSRQVDNAAPLSFTVDVEGLVAGEPEQVEAHHRTTTEEWPSVAGSPAPPTPSESEDEYISTPQCDPVPVTRRIRSHDDLKSRADRARAMNNPVEFAVEDVTRRTQWFMPRWRQSPERPKSRTSRRKSVPGEASGSSESDDGCESDQEPCDMEIRRSFGFERHRAVLTQLEENVFELAKMSAQRHSKSPILALLEHDGMRGRSPCSPCPDAHMTLDPKSWVPSNYSTDLCDGEAGSALSSAARKLAAGTISPYEYTQIAKVLAMAQAVESEETSGSMSYPKQHNTSKYADWTAFASRFSFRNRQALQEIQPNAR